MSLNRQTNVKLYFHSYISYCMQTSNLFVFPRCGLHVNANCVMQNEGFLVPGS